jgi:C1A family cysteine protease
VTDTLDREITMTYTTKHYGWVHDLPDARDHLYAAPAPVIGGLPSSADLRPQCPPVYDQGELGSCTGNAIAGAIQFERLRQKLPSSEFTPSRLFIYYNERVIEHTVSSDSGAQIRDGIKTVVQQGACFEDSPQNAWPYDIAKFATPPDPGCYQIARTDEVASYARVAQIANQMKGCLAAGFPFVFGFTVYQSFESPAVTKTGTVPMPSPSEQVVGGHAVMAVGYDDTQQRFIVRNSWGPAWGQKGYCTMPYAYLTDPNLASDFWTIRLVKAN